MVVVKQMAATLKEIVVKTRKPDELNEHPWTNALFVGQHVQANSHLQSRRRGYQLISAIAEQFRATQPLKPPELHKIKSKRNASWGRFAAVGAYLRPLLSDGLRPPTTLEEAGDHINDTILYFVFGPERSQVTPEQEERYKLIKYEISDDSIAPVSRSTLRDWQDDGLAELAESIFRVEDKLSQQLGESSPVLNALQAESKDSAQITRDTQEAIGKISDAVFTAPADKPLPSSRAAVNQTLGTSDVLAIYRQHILTDVTESFLEWQSVFDKMAYFPRLLIQSSALAGKTRLALAARQYLLSSTDVFPLYVDVCHYGHFAEDRDVIRYAVEDGEIGRVLKDVVLADPGMARQITAVLSRHESSKQLLVIADQTDHLPANSDRAEVARRLESHKRLVVLERQPSLPLMRDVYATTELPSLMLTTQHNFLAQTFPELNIDAFRVRDDYIEWPFMRHHVGWLKTYGQAYQSKPERYHPVIVVMYFFQALLEQVNPQIREELIEILKRIAVAMLLPERGKELRERLGIPEIHAVLQSGPTPPEMVEQRLDLARQIGVLDYGPGGWGFAQREVSRYLVADHLSREGTAAIFLPGMDREATHWVRPLLEWREDERMLSALGFR